MNLKIAPSILSADRKKLQSEVAQVEPYSDLIHVDIMDGKFVPPTTFSPAEIKSIRTRLPKDVHLMVDYPLADKHIDRFIAAGASIITIHQECKDDLLECIKYIKLKGAMPSLAIRPKTPLETILLYLRKVDMVLIMSVEPGYAGQAFMPAVLQKVRELRDIRKDMDIEIDGGITTQTIKDAVSAGANVIVAASAVFGKNDRKQAILDLRNACK